MSEPISNPNPAPESTPTPAPEPAPERTFTQAEVDSMVNRRLAKAMKGMPGEEELTAFRAWKEGQQTEQEKWDTLTRERDESRTALTAAQEELEQYRREKLLLGRGVSPDDVDYYAFKIGKLVTEDTDFETAAEQYLKDHAPKEPEKPAGTVRVDLGGPLGGGGAAVGLNDRINNMLRGR